LRREYGLDLDDLWAGDLRPTVLLELVDNLSPQASLWRALDPDVVWDLPGTLLALLVDEIRVLRWEFERVNFKGKNRPPDPLPRPGVKPPEDKATFGGGASALPIDEMAEWLGWTRTPEITPAGRALPHRDTRGRFTKN